MKTVLITGIGRGIGRALAEKFLAEGYAVIGTVLTSATPLTHPHLHSYLLDLSKSESIQKCAAAIKKSGHTIDILINNAGIMADEKEVSVIIDKLRKNLEVNLIGTIDFTERIIPLMDAADGGGANAGGGGHIVSISSQAGSLAEADILADTHEPYHYPAYKISKCAINMYTRTLAVRMDHEKTGIIVSSVHPGWVKTNMGGAEAPTTPEEAAEEIFKLAISRPETGQFWYNGKKYPW